MIVNLNGNKLLMISSETFKDIRTLGKVYRVLLRNKQ